jgi:hypothetical protein
MFFFWPVLYSHLYNHSIVSSTKRMFPFMFYDNYFLGIYDLSSKLIISFSILGYDLLTYFFIYLFFSFLGVLFFLQSKIQYLSS